MCHNTLLPGICRGGTQVTVEGTNLDAVAAPGLNIKQECRTELISENNTHFTLVKTEEYDTVSDQ